MKEWLKAAAIAGIGVTLYLLGFTFGAGFVAGWLGFWLIANIRLNLGR